MQDHHNDNPDLDLEDEQDQDSGVWLSISDLMSALLLFFALLFITTQVQLQKYQEIIEELPLLIQKALKEKSGISDDVVKVDSETGNVAIDDKILFAEGESELTPKGKNFLDKFIPVYSKVIFSEQKFEEKIVRVVIVGHTSSKGSERANRNLSLERAQSVANYIFSDQLDFQNEEQFQEKILISGRGEIDANQKIDDPKDRKVTFRFQLRRPDFGESVDKQREQMKKSIDKNSN